ncbi:hypothetical protein D3C74_320400 [compost metagenome]
MKDRHWCGMLHLFRNQDTLKRFLTEQYFDLEEGSIRVVALKRLARPWSQSEKFMLNLALHLFNEQLAKVSLSDMDYLDTRNKQLAFEAMKLRFGS